MFHVTAEDPRILDEQFALVYPALELVTTLNSGAYHGDGDLRARATDYSKVQFAVESKARFSESYRDCKPKPDEWEKAMGTSDRAKRGQLRMRNAGAIRLFLVYNARLRDFAVSMPQEDAKQLAAYGVAAPGKLEKMKRKGQTIYYVHYNRTAWNALYERIREVLGNVPAVLDGRPSNA
jgi:hypothetical protein